MSAPSHPLPGDLAPLPALAPPELARGISFSGWFSHPQPPPGHRDGFITEEDFHSVAALGFTHVRIPFHPALLQEAAPPFRLREDGFRCVDRALDWAERHGLACVLDLRPSPPPPLDAPPRPGDRPQASPPRPAAAAALSALWRAIARRYRDRPASLVYELLNEPRIEDAAAWQRIAGEWLAAIRSVDAVHTLVVPGPRRSGAADLPDLRPLPDDNVVYAFHFYFPHAFTLQGAPWAGPELALLHAVPYPADADRIAALIRHLAAIWPRPERLPAPSRAFAPTAPEPLMSHLAFHKVRQQLRDYAASGCDRDGLAEVMAPALAWARRHRVPLYCSQFGVHKPFAPPDSRCRWHADVTALLHAAGAGWALCDYCGDSALLDAGENGRRVVDLPLLDALGLPAHPPPPPDPPLGRHNLAISRSPPPGAPRCRRKLR